MCLQVVKFFAEILDQHWQIGLDSKYFNSRVNFGAIGKLFAKAEYVVARFPEAQNYGE